jgi:hypothetical protein
LYIPINLEFIRRNVALKNSAKRLGKIHFWRCPAAFFGWVLFDARRRSIPPSMGIGFRLIYAAQPHVRRKLLGRYILRHCVPIEIG